MLGLPRKRFTTEFNRFDSSRFAFAARDGLVALRATGAFADARSICRNRALQASAFLS